MKANWNKRSMAAVTRQSYSRAAIAKLIKKAWPDGIVDMPIDEDESYFWDIYDNLRAKISKLPGASMLHESWPSPQTSSIDDDDADEDWLDKVFQEPSRSWHLFALRPQTRIELPMNLEEDPGEADDFQADDSQDDAQSEFDTEGFDEPAVIGSSLGFLLAVSLVAPVAIVMEYVMDETEYGTDASPPLALPCAFDSEDKIVEPDYSSDLSADDRKRAGAIRQRLVRVAEKTGLLVLPFDQRQETVPGLHAGSEAFLNEPITVQTAFFFEGP
jgi:hypothetical protein